MTIDTQIRKANLRDVVNPLSGDCATVASALVDVFEGTYVCLYSDEDHQNETLPAHVVVEIDGELYDGSGKTSKQDLFEIHLVMNGFATESEDLSKYFVSEAPPDYMIDSERKEKVMKAL